MSIFDFFNKFKEKRDKEKRAHKAKVELEKLGSTTNYREGIIKSFHVLETFGTEYLGISRGEAITAREYIQLLEEDGIIRKDELKDLVTAFEVSKYSTFDPTEDNFKKVLSTVTDLEKRFKAPKAKVAKGKGKLKKGKRRRRSRSGSSSDTTKRKIKKRVD